MRKPDEDVKSEALEKAAADMSEDEVLLKQAVETIKGSE